MCGGLFSPLLLPHGKTESITIAAGPAFSDSRIPVPAGIMTEHDKAEKCLAVPPPRHVFSWFRNGTACLPGPARLVPLSTDDLGAAGPGRRRRRR